MVTAMGVLMCLAGLPLGLQDSAAEPDPIRLLDAEHATASRAAARLSADERLPYYEEWLERWRQAVEKYPDHPSSDLARRRVVALFNSLGRYRESLEVLEELLQRAHSDWGRRQALYDLGEGSYAAHFETRDPALARRCIDTFARLRGLETEPSGWSVLGLVRTAFLQSHAFGKHREAGDLYRQAADESPVVVAADRSGTVAGSSVDEVENFLWEAAWEYAQADEPERAVEMMQRLERLPSLKVTMARHLGELIERAHNLAGLARYCEHAAAWLAKNPDDKHGPKLAHELAVGFKHAGDMPNAIRYNETVLAYSERGAYAEENAKYAGWAVTSLVDIYLRNGEREKAETLRKRYSK